MSLSRSALPLTSSHLIFKFASQVASTAARSCSHKPRDFNSYSALSLPSTRKLQTQTAYRPHSLEPVPPPPRNIGIPDSSIAGTIPEIDNTRSPRLTDEHETPRNSKQNERQSISMTEGEAQKTKPIAQAAYSTKPQRPKLRARKAAMALTPSAIGQLRRLLELPEPKLIRVGVKNRGCSGLAYHLEYVDKAGTFDEAVEQDGVKVLIDSKALFSIIGSEMDWVEDKLNQRFVFRNPNISESQYLCYPNTHQKLKIFVRGTMRLWRVFHGLVIKSTLNICIFQRHLDGLLPIKRLTGKYRTPILIHPQLQTLLPRLLHQMTPSSKSTITGFSTSPARLFLNAR